MIYQIKSILSLLFFKTTEEYSELFIFIFLDFYRIGSALLPPPQYNFFVSHKNIRKVIFYAVKCYIKVIFILDYKSKK